MLFGKTLYSKLVRVQLILVLFVVFTSGIISYFMMQDHFEENTQTNLRTNAVSIAKITSNEIDSLSINFEHVASNNVIEKYVQTYNSSALLNFFKIYSNQFPALSYINDKGAEEVKLINGKQSTDLQNIKHTNAFSLGGENANKVIVDGPFFSPALTEKTLSFNYCYIDFFDDFVGFVQGNVPLSHFSKLLENAGLHKQGGLLILSENSTIIYSSVPDLQGKNINQTKTETALIKALNTNTDSHGHYNLLGEKSFLYAYSEPKRQWKILTYIPSTHFFSELESLRNTLLAIAIALIILSTLIIYFLSKTITKPIKLLNKVTTNISEKGKITQRVKWQSKDELGLLASSFNKMLDQLEDSHTDLVDSHQHIQDIVTSMADALIVTNPDGEIIKANRSAMKMLKHHEEILLGKNIISYICDEDDYSTLITRRSPRSIINIETNLTPLEGDTIPISISSSVLHNAKGQVQGIVFVIKDITERKQAEAHLHHLANHDALTGLPNRLLLLDRMSQAITRLRWHKRHLAVMFLDLDRFKIVNDSLGHDTGDLLLKGVSERLCSCVRDGDTVARLGGDEFVIMLNDISHKDDVINVAEKIIHSLSEAIQLGEHQFVATTSIGISLFPEDGDDPYELLKNADTAMYQAKASGRNNYKTYTTNMNEKADEKIHIENDMRRALDNGEFILHYQPQVSLSTGTVIGFEALVRWQHPEKGLIPPMDFLSIAEETGLMIPIGEYVLYSACLQGKKWIDQGLEPVSIGVNIAHDQFVKIDLPQLIRRVLDETGFPAQHLDLELTEGILMESSNTPTEVITQLKEIGVTISIDDFGTGYSSLSHLKHFKIDTLKIDRSFIRDTPDDSDDVAIVTAIIQMAKNLNLNVIAEGAETEDQITLLNNLECDAFQGYYFSKPLPVDDIEKFPRKMKLFNSDSYDPVI